MEEHLEVVDRAGEGAVYAEVPAERALLQGARDALDGAREIGEATEPGHGRRAAQATGLALERVGRRPRVWGAGQQRVELLQAFAGLEHEEIEQPA